MRYFWNVFRDVCRVYTYAYTMYVFAILHQMNTPRKPSIPDPLTHARWGKEHRHVNSKQVQTVLQSSTDDETENSASSPVTIIIFVMSLPQPVPPSWKVCFFPPPHRFILSVFFTRIISDTSFLLKTGPRQVFWWLAGQGLPNRFDWPWG